jgi:hypothetical protein
MAQMSNAQYPIETLASAMAHAAYEAFPPYTYMDRNWANYDKWISGLTREQRASNPTPPADCLIEKTRNHTMYDLTVYAMFVQTWGSTALGFGGIGGQAITSAYVCVIKSNLGSGFAVYFNGQLAYIINKANSQFIEDVARHKMVDAKLGKSTYERTN